MKAKTTRMRIFSSLVALLLAGGLAATAGFADADTGSSLEEGDLATMLERQLDRGRSSTPSTELDTLTEATNPGPIHLASRIALAALVVAGVIFGVALWVKRGRERRLGDELGSNLAVKDSVWIGRGQRVVLLTFESHKVLVGVSGGALHNLGIFGEGGAEIPTDNPIERDAARRRGEASRPTEFADFVKGELASNLSGQSGGNRDRRRQMLTELNSL